MVGPGIGSASVEVAWSSLWQKYWPAKQLLQADDLRASRGGVANTLNGLPHIGGGVVHRMCWTRPSVTEVAAASVMEVNDNAVVASGRWCG